MFCKNCGEQMNDNQAICLKCGVKTGEGNLYCANCGNTVNPGAEVCLSCGVAVKKAAAAGTYGKYDKMVIAIVCFFLGGLGIHNFMLGETKKGIIKIVFSILCGIGGILALIDFIKILMDKYEVDPNKAF
ncbi:MAG: TM2 domain-containing protein [Clostridia bacterium]|nr:TM2 domain-containing protein [Clostridia bacterium]